MAQMLIDINKCSMILRIHLLSMLLKRQIYIITDYVKSENGGKQGLAIHLHPQKCTLIPSKNKAQL